MNDINLYEKIPKEQFPIKMLWDYQNKYDFPPHWHEHIELHYVMNGSCQLQYSEETIELGAGDCVVINGNELHQGGGGLCDYVVILLPPDLFEPHHVIFQKVIRDEYAAGLVMNALEKYRTHNAVDMLEVKGYIYLLIAHLIRCYTYKTLTETVYSRYFDKLNKVNGAVRYINENYDKVLTTRSLSEMVHLSEGYFCQVFKEVTGKTAMEYINQLRMDKAEKMLMKTEMTVTEVAFSCGFDDANYFSRMFKKIKGKSPQSVRNVSNIKNELEEV
ncbi:MAG: AraC family transcriptional regulator [Clostridia bacterium]|nr:AraC family transcriptional regulator [Clostridia bacterium]